MLMCIIDQDNDAKDKVVTYQIVQCEVLWAADYYVSGNETLGTPHTLGVFETEGDACQAFAEAGFTRQENNSWVAPYSRGDITRILREIK
jgi:hypothetical protein